MKLRNLTLLSAVILAGGAFALNLAARSAAQRISAVVAPLAKLDFDGAGISLNGSIRLDSPQLTIGNEPDQTRLRADTAYLKGSGLGWLVGYLMDDAGTLPESLSITMRGFKLADDSSRTSLSRWMGLSSRALFENAGCGSDALGAKDYVKMGLSPEPSRDRISYRYDLAGNRLEIAFDLDSPDMARWQGATELKGFDPSRWSDERARQAVRIVRANLSYNDPGFLSRRNRFCANWLGIDADQFVTQHVDAVKSILASHGIKPSNDLVALYHRIVSRGGTLNVSSLPKSDWIPAEWTAYPRQDLLRQLNVTARLEDAPPIMLDLTFSQPEVPLYRVTPDPEVLPTAEATTETVAQDATVESGIATPSPPVVTTVDTPIAAVDAQSAPSIVSTEPSEPASFPVQPGKPALDDGKATAAVVSSGQEPAKAPVASSEPPPPGSTMALVWKPGEIQRLPPAESPKPTHAVIPTAQIAAHVGQRIQLLTEGGRRVDGELKSVDATNVILLVEASSGRAELSVPLAQIREARLRIRNHDGS
jgi:small nuclear ribonucleoprotein (snRNP)-like protein